jgi:hypothetical protein
MRNMVIRNKIEPGNVLVLAICYFLKIEILLTHKIGSNVKHPERLTVANRLGQRLNQHRQIASNVVHEEKEHAQCC